MPIIRRFGVLLGGSIIGCAFATGCEGPGHEREEEGLGAARTADEPLAAEPASQAAISAIDRVQDRFRLSSVARPANLRIKGASKAQPTTTVSRPVVASTAARLLREGGGFKAEWAENNGVEAWLPQRSIDAFRLRDRASGMAIETRLVGVQDAEAQVARGIAVYEGAAPGGGTVIHRLTDGGTEDYATIEARPEKPELSYDVSLAGVAGLREVGNTIEFLDASSTPRLRISSPYLVGRDGKVVEATLSLSDCDADRDPSAPWGRAVVAPGKNRCRVDVRWDADAVEYPAIVDPSWSSTANMASARTFFVGAPLSTNLVLVAGGVNAAFATVNTAELYNPTTRTWASTASMATARAHHDAAVRGTGTVLVTGGVGTSGWLSSVESYNPSTGTWTTRPSMGVARANHRLTTLANGDVLVTGGTVDGSLMTQRFSNVSATWSNSGNLLSDMSMHTATLLADGRVINVSDTGTVGQIFDPSSNAWFFTATPPVARSGHAAVRLANGQLLVMGGTGSSSVSAEIFDPSGIWGQTGSLWQEHSYGQAVRLSDNRVLYFGGQGGNSRLTSEIYDPAWGTWRPGPALTPNRQFTVAVPMQNNRVLIAGGQLGSAVPVNTATEFVPTTAATSAVEYKFTAAVDADVMPSVATEVWGVMYRPTTLPSGRLPVLVFLHGNHGTCGTGSNPREDNTCEYTTSGTCPSGSTMSPSFKGYEYVGRELASRGYLVVSINANRGITCGGDQAGDVALILARGRLILKHLQRLSDWNRGAQTTPASIGVSLQNKLDLTQVGLMGHSRGGEGIRAAYNLYRASGSPWPARIVDPVTFRGLFEIGPTEWRGDQNALGTAWNVLLPMCDGDVSNLSGVRAFDRMLYLSESPSKPKSTTTVWGANHNFYNSEWQQSDAWSCIDHNPLFSLSGTELNGTARQRQSGFKPMLSFFTANVGNTNAPIDSWFNNFFNPQVSDWWMDPQIDRGYVPGAGTTQSLMLEDFTGASGTSSYGKANVHSGVTVTHGNLPEHDAVLRGAEMSWTTNTAYFQTNMANSGSGLNLSSYATLDLRLERAYDAALNTSSYTYVSVQLVNANGTLSSNNLVPIALTGPVGGTNRHSMLQTARVALSTFTGANLASIRGVRLNLGNSSSGRIYVANIRASVSTTVTSALVAAAASNTEGVSAQPPTKTAADSVVPGLGSAPILQQVTSGNQVVAIRRTPDGASVEIEVATTKPFQPRDSMLVLRSDTAKSQLSRFANGNLTRVIFTLDRASFDGIANGSPIRVRYEPTSNIEWTFGPLDKTLLQP